MGCITLFVKTVANETHELTQSIDWWHKLLRIQVKAKSPFRNCQFRDSVFSLSYNLPHHKYILKDFSRTTKPHFLQDLGREGCALEGLFNYAWNPVACKTKTKYFFPDAPRGSNPKTLCHWNHFSTGLILRLYATCQSATDLEASRASKALSWYLHYTTKSCPSGTCYVYMHDILAEMTTVCISLFCLFGGVVYLFSTTISLEGDFHRRHCTGSRWVCCAVIKRIIMNVLLLTSFRGQAFTLSFPVSLHLIFHILWSQNCKNLFTIKPFKISWWRARHWCSVLKGLFWERNKAE